MKPSTEPNRRTFLKGAAFASTIQFLPKNVFGAPGKPSANNKLNIAAIGVGGKGYHDVRGVPTENIVALCDVDTRASARAAKGLSNPVIYQDFRKMLETEKSIDAVMIATPDHSHAVITMMALKMGKHVFCQKPLTHTVHEAIEIGKAAKAAGVATQMGNQAQATEGARLVSEFIMDGAIGKVREVHAWSNRSNPISPRGIPRPSDSPAVPEQLDWDLWLGPAPERPYHPTYHPFSWRGWWDFGSGVLGDIGCHQQSAVYKALNLGWPESVEASSTHLHASEAVKRETAPHASIITYQFAATDHHGPITLRWYDGGMMPVFPEGVDSSRALFLNDGCMVVGDQGALHNHRLLPEEKMKDYGKPPRVLERSPGHYQEWLRACKGGPKAGSDFVDHAAHLTAVVQMGNIAIRTGGKLYWDPEKLRFKNSDRANALMAPPYRAGWSLT
ncbi:MAG: putative dehydrogenase [Kiritimatiellia bacterium]|jgi:predicted dehydrogenase